MSMDVMQQYKQISTQRCNTWHNQIL